MKKLIAGLLAVCLGTSLSAATGSSESEAREISVSSTQFDSNVTLVKETGDEWFSSGCYYFKATLKKGASYTVWYENYDAASIDLDAYAGGDGFDGPWAGFSMTTQQGSRYVSWLKSSDWDSEDPSSWPFYFKLEGEVGMKTQFHIVQGIKTFIEEGDEQNPKTLKFTDAEQTGKYTITQNGDYFLQADLTAGRKYLIRTTTGTAEAPLTLTLGSDYSYEAEVDPAYASDKTNTSLIVYPKESGTFVFRAYGAGAGKSFGLAYQSVPARAIEKHAYATLAEGAAQTFRPGRLIADADYYDSIVDECLFRFTASKGDWWIVDATGADRAVEMRLYDSKGNVLESSAASGKVRVGYEVTTSGDYYVGVFDPALATTSAVVCAETKIVAFRVNVEDDVPEAICPAPGTMKDDPLVAGAVSGPYTLDETHWTRTLTIAGRAGVTYSLATSLAGGRTTDLTLSATVFRYSGSNELVVDDLRDVRLLPGQVLAFEASVNAAYGVRLSVYEGEGMDYPKFNVHALGASAEAGLGILTVNIRGAEAATWSFDSESVKYQGGDSVLLPTNEACTVRFAKVGGFSTPDDVTTMVAGKEPTVVVGSYSDLYDPTDDEYRGATKLTVTADETYAGRTLWGDDGTGHVADEADWFYVVAQNGVYYNFRLCDLEGDAVMSIYEEVNGKPAAEAVASAVTNVSKMVLGEGGFYICVDHGTDASADSSYSLAYSSANVGTVGFAKTAVAAKKTDGTVELTVVRTARDGHVRVRYATVAGSALPGERYVAQSGILEWEAGDGSSRDLEIKLIPDLVAYYRGDTAFTVELEPMLDEEIGKDEYPAQVIGGICTVTVRETAKSSVTSVEDAYAKSQPKVASVSTEDTALRAGTFFGVLSEDGSALTNGLPQLASITVTSTVKAGKADSLTAKVSLAGKSYTFKTNSKDPEEWVDVGDGYKRIVLTDDADELTITVKDGETTDANAWTNAGGTVELVMNVPDVKGKGEQEGIRYCGEIFRQNAKIDGYLKAVAETFYGYYTLALVPDGVTSMDGIPAGNGYLTVKVDNKGTATVAGLLADGTKVSCKVTAAAIRGDASSANGYAMYLPVFQAKSPYCFGGTLKLTAKAGTTLPDEDVVRVVDSTSELVWNNDNASLTYYNEDGWRISCSPVGGWYDTVMNLEAYYLNYALSVGTADISEFPAEQLADGYSYVTGVQPNGEPVAFENDVLSTAKRSLVKDGKLYDLVSSVNPCNVQLKLKRATGVVTGSFSLWSEDGSSQKEIKSIKHNGVLILSRDDFSLLDAEVISAGFCSAKVTVSEGGKSRKWTYSLPFNVLAAEQDAVDPWAADKGWNPAWGEEPTEFETK